MKYDTFDPIKETTGGAYSKDNKCYIIKISCK